MKDERTSLRAYLLRKPVRTRTIVCAIGAGLLAIYIPMIAVAMMGLWANNLFRWNTNWPWSVVFAFLNLISPKRSLSIAVHCVIFGSLLIWKVTSISQLYADASLPLPFSAYLVFALAFAMPIVNLIAYPWLAKKLDLPTWPRLFGRTGDATPSRRGATDRA